MTRHLRIEFPKYNGEHVMNRGRRGENIFGNTDVFERFIHLLQRISEIRTICQLLYKIRTNIRPISDIFMPLYLEEAGPDAIDLTGEEVELS